MLKLKSRDVRNEQQVLADRARQIDLPDNEITRIRTGDFTESEFTRIEDARRVLKENDFDKELKLLDNRRNQQELLLSHYSGNLPEGINPLAKFRALRRSGFSREALQTLGDETVLGTKWTPKRIYARLMTPEEAEFFDATGILKSEPGELVPVLDITSVRRLVEISGYSKNQLKELHKKVGGDSSRNVIRIFSSPTPPDVEWIRLKNTPDWIKETKFKEGTKVKKEEIKQLD